MMLSENAVESLFEHNEKKNTTTREKKSRRKYKKVGSCPYLSDGDDSISSDDEMNSGSKNSETSSEDNPRTESSSGYASSSDEGNTQKLANFEQPVDEISDLLSQASDMYHVQDLPDDLKKLVLVGITQGLPDDYNVPIDNKPDWLDMDKFKRGQEFARKYYCGVSLADMASLFILFGLPGGTESVIFSENSSTPFTAFKRYLSTVIRVTSWYDYDIWSKGNPGYQNIKTVRAMHLNISKRMERTPFDDLKNQVTLAGSPKCPAIWNTSVKDSIQEDYKSGCPFHVAQSNHHILKRNVFVNQMEMSVTQFGFVGLMVTFPEKFGAASASKEELEAFLHTWRGICYLLGVQDEFNFCNGTLEDVVKRCHSLIENWIKPSFQNLPKDWEHMSRCLVEGMGYVASTDKPVLSFEVSMMHLFWILEIPAPRLYSTLTWNQRFEFFTIKFLMTRAVKFPGVLPLMNWIMRRMIEKAALMPAEEIEKLKNKKYEYEGIVKTVKKDDTVLSKTFSRASLLLLLFLTRTFV